MSKTPQAGPPIVPTSASVDAPPKDARRIQVRRSGVHGKGLFALQPISAGQRILEYKGELITWAQALRRHPHDPDDPNHTFYFHVDDKHVIDGKVGGNATRWINHSCDPNCEAEVSGQRVFIHALHDLEPGDELFFDYRLVLDGRHTPKVKQEYACHCGSPRCRGTMLGRK
jgi:SET domain-containing protein